MSFVPEMRLPRHCEFRDQATFLLGISLLFRATFRDHVEKAEVETGEERLSAQQKKQNRADDEANGKGRLQGTETSQFPLMGCHYAQSNAETNQGQTSQETSLQCSTSR